MKKTLIIFTIIFTLILIFLAVLPTLISTSWGTSQVLNIVNKKIPGKIQIEHLSINWFGPQIIQNATLKDREGNFVAHIDKINTDSSIFNLLLKKGREQNIEIADFDIIIREEANGSTNLHETLGLANPTSTRPNKRRPPLKLELTNVYAKVNLHSIKEPIQIFLKGNTKQGDINGNFSFDILLAQAIIKNETILNPIQLTANVSHFPIAIIDHFVSLTQPELTGTIRTLLGETLELSLKQQEIEGGFSFKLLSKTPSSSLASEGKIENGRVHLTKKSIATLDLDPAAFESLKALSKTRIELKLLDPTKITLALDQLDFSLKFLNNQANAAKDVPPIIMGKLNITPTAIQGNALPKPVNIRHLSVDIIAPQSSTEFLLKVNAEAEQEKKPLQISLNANFDKPNTIQELLELSNQRDKPTAKQSKIQLSINLPSMIIPEVPQLGNVTINQLKLDLNGTPFDKMEGTLIASILPENPAILSLLGSAVEIKANAFLKMSESQKWIVEPSVASIESRLLKADIKGSFSSDQQLTLIDPIIIDYKILPKNLMFLKLEEKGVKLEATPLKIKVLPFTASLDQLLTIPHQAIISLESAKLDFAKGDHALIQNINIPIKYSPRDKQININVAADSILNQNVPSKISGHILLTNWLNATNQINLDTAILKTDLNISDFPSSLLATYTEIMPIQDLLGSLINLHLISSADLSTMQGQYNLTLDGQDLHGKFVANLNKDSLFNDQKTPITLSMKLTPARFAALLKLTNNKSDNKPTLIEDSNINIKISTLNIPRNFSLQNTQITAALSVDKIQLQKEKEQKIAFENVLVAIESPNLMHSINFKMDAEERSKNNRYPIMLNGDAKDYLNQKGEVDLSQLSLNLEVKSPRLPASLVSQLGSLDNKISQKIEALFGETIDTDIKVKLQKMHGPLFVKLDGPNGKLVLDAQLNDGSMSLNVPFEAAFTVTPELEKSIIQDIIPILTGVISAEQPIKIKVDSSGFFLPLKQIDLNKIIIGKATIELGKMLFSDKGTLVSVFDLLGRTHKDELSVKFTPLYFSMDRGTIKLSRMDMLFMGQYPMAIWGKVNPVKDNVDIRIGITGVALARAFNVSGVEKNYMLQLPLTGTLSNAAIDKTKAIGRISALIAHSQGTPQGTLLGAVLGLASGGLAEDAVPAPTTNPLPWDLSMDKEVSKDKGSQASSSKKEKKNVADEVEKAASALIENFFK